jgi:hypothetical protein
MKEIALSSEVSSEDVNIKVAGHTVQTTRKFSIDDAERDGSVKSVASNSSGTGQDVRTLRTDSAGNLSGYLYKKTREGRWQKRWFETNGVYLTYYKSWKMEKLLAALSLLQVSEVKIMPTVQGDTDSKPGLFALWLNTRVYTLRAKTDADALLWVETLNKIKEERASMGSNIDASSASEKMNNKLLRQNKSGWRKDRTISAWKRLFCCCLF